MLHPSAEFIVLYAGRLHILVYRPTDNTLPIPELYTEDLDFDEPCGTRITVMCDGDVPQSVKILAKQNYDYEDDEAFTPERKSNIKRSELWDSLERQFLRQKK